MSRRDAESIVNLGIGATRIAVVAASVASQNKDPLLPVYVAALGEGVDVLAQNHKDRATEWLLTLASKVQGLPHDLRQRFSTRSGEPEGEYFFEEAWRKAAETVDPLKRKAIASLVKNGLSAEELEMHNCRLLLRILDQVDEVELIFLQSLTEKFRDDSHFLETHKNVLTGPRKPARIRRYNYPAGGSQTKEESSHFLEQEKKYQIEREKHALYDSRINHLVDIGLLGANPMSHHGDLQLTPLGTALMKIVDLAEDTEWGEGEQSNSVQALQTAQAGTRELQRQYSEDKQNTQKKTAKEAAELERLLRQATRNAR